MPLTSLILPLLLQAGPNPATGAIPDYSAEVQDRPPRELAEQAAPRAEPTWLEECFELVDSDPARANVKAQVRRDSTTGNDRILANHCLGLSATVLQRWDEARLAFLAARDESPAEDHAFRARLGAMAGNATLPTGDIESALAILDQAEADARTSASADLIALVEVDKARALVALGKLDQAEPLLRDAADLRPKDAEPSLLLATLLRRMGRLDEAQAAISQAGERDPVNPSVGLEAGVIAVLSGREDSARQSWQSVIDTAPGSDEAEVAHIYLDELGPTGSDQ